MVHSNYSLFPGISQQSGSASAAHAAEATLDLQASRYRLNPWDPNQTLRCICKKRAGFAGLNAYTSALRKFGATDLHLRDDVLDGSCGGEEVLKDSFSLGRLAE